MEWLSGLWRIACATLLLVGLGACDGHDDDAGVDLHGRRLDNRIAYIPPQCFTRTHEAAGAPAQNPCYACHAEARAPNELSQPELQTAYAFPQLKAGGDVQNPWRNLFVDRRPAIDRISDDEMRRYVSEDNYHAASGAPDLISRLARPPARWDADGDGRWGGYVPDASFRFDANGYDHAPDGTPSGWRAFSYFPFPGAFMPTNGAFDDVAIRLPPAFRQDESGREDAVIYGINLSIVEALITRRDVPIDAADERQVGVDLDHDGRLGIADRIAYDWAPLAQRTMSYAGRARIEQAAGRVHLAAGLFPEGTEFIHSVRYLAAQADGRVAAAPRMKELRYARKQSWRSYSQLRHRATLESREQALKPDFAESFLGDAEHGLANPQGWVYQGFIEDARGRLRPQTYEETVYCMGCHSGLSATDDSSFSFARKLRQGTSRGWTHPASAGSPLGGDIGDPPRADGEPEYASYLRANRAGDEFRANTDVLARYFDAAGAEKPEAFDALRRDVSTLLLPSPERALALDKAYWLVVREQSFALGRDALPAPAANVLRDVRQDSPTGITEPLPAPRLAVR